MAHTINTAWISQQKPSQGSVQWMLSSCDLHWNVWRGTLLTFFTTSSIWCCWKMPDRRNFNLSSHSLIQTRGKCSRKLGDIKQQHFSHKTWRALKIYLSLSHSADRITVNLGNSVSLQCPNAQSDWKRESLEWVLGKNSLLRAVTLGFLPPIPSFPVSNKIRTKSVVFCFLSLGVPVPFCHCRGPCSQKSHLVSFCAPVCFSSPLLFTLHFCSLTLRQYLLPLPVFSFLNHFIPFPAHSNQHYSESHILFFILASNWGSFP